MNASQWQQLKQRLEAGDAAVADEIAAAVRQRCDARGDHTAWGLLCEQAGLFGLARTEFELALRDDPNDREASLKLAEYLAEQGAFDRAVQLLERVLEADPADQQALELLCPLLRQDGAIPRLEQVLQRAVQAGLPPQHARHLRGRAEEPEATATVPDLSPTDADCVRMATLFAGREDVHARQWSDPGTKRTGYTPVHEPLTPGVIRNHLLGAYTVGVYPIRLDGTACWFAIDLDIDRPALERARRDAVVAQSLRDTIRHLGPALLNILRDLGLQPLFENSGYKGRHYWVFLQHPEDAAVLHQFGKLLLARLQPELPDEFHLEFVPKQARRSGKGLGNLIKLPLGIHRRTGYRSLFLDDRGQPRPDQLGTLRDIPRLERESLHRIADTLKSTAVAMPAVPEREVEAPDSTTAAPPAPAPPELPPAWTEADFETDRQVRHLLSRCPVLATLKRQVDEHRQLKHDERLVLIHTLGHLDSGPQAVNYLLQKCLDVAPDQMLKSPLRGNPMSCPKIRKRIGHITRRVDCNCDFSFAPNHYPTPTLHLLTLPPEPIRPERATVAVDPETLARRFGVLQRRKQEIEQEWKDTHDQLCQVLGRLPDRTLLLPEGRFRLIVKEGVEELVWEEQPATTPDAKDTPGAAAGGTTPTDGSASDEAAPRDSA